jgi:hypothetical protein
VAVLEHATPEDVALWELRISRQQFERLLTVRLDQLEGG